MKKGNNKQERDPSSENRKYRKEIEYDNSRDYQVIEVPLTEFKDVPAGKTFLRTYELTELGQRFGCFYTYLNAATLFKKTGERRAEKIISRKAENIGKAVVLKPDEKVFVVPSLHIFHS